MKCQYACDQAGPAINAVPPIVVLLIFVALVAGMIYLCNLPDIPTERELRNERLRNQPSTKPGWSLEENRARVLAYYEAEAREERRKALEAAAAEFSVDAELVVEHEQELVA